jgi:sec-independent protein translocase protein TatA
VVLLLFGATRLPKLARSMGEATKEFKKGIGEKEAEAAAAPPPSEQKVTMTQAELDAMLAEREVQARAADSGDRAAENGQQARRKDPSPPSS